MKFSLDWCFGLLKQKLRQTKVDNLDDLKKAVENSATVNLPQLPRIIVTMLQKNLSHAFMKILSIKKIHQFHITRDDSRTPILNILVSSFTLHHTQSIEGMSISVRLRG